MITGIGIDLEVIERFRKACTDDHFLNLIFTKREIAYCRRKKEPPISFAGKFCAKEAVIKSCKEKIAMKDIEIRNSPSGKLQIYLRGKREPSVLCSISHTEEYALALAIIDDAADT